MINLLPTTEFMENTMQRHSSLIKPLLITMLLSLLLGTSAWAASLQANRASGALGESHTGFVVARQASAQADADATNAKRRALYAEKAKAQGVSVDQVGRVYAQEIIKKVPKGTWIQNASGKWYQK